jgi:hypothetical protein
MRFFPAVLVLSVLALSAPAASAQSCALPSGVEFIRTQNCRFGGWPTLCRPGESIKLSADVPTTPQTCPFTVTWDFGDGTPVQQVAGNQVEHVFAKSGMVKVKASVQTRTGIESYSELYLIAHGYVTVQTAEQVFEGDGFSLTVSRDDTLVATTLDYQTMPSPFLEQKRGRVQFAAGEAKKTVPFKTIDSLFFEGQKTAQVSWSNPVDHDFQAGKTTTTTVVIMEDDEDTDHRCRETALTAHEEDGFVRVRLDRSGNLTLPSTGTVTIPVPSFGRPHWLNNTGTWSVAFAPGQTSADVDIPLQNNALWDGHQQTKVACGGFTGTLPIDHDSELLLTIDDDDPVPSLSVPPIVTITESDATQTVVVPLTVSAGSTMPVWIGVKATDDTATGDDYALQTNVVQLWNGETSKPLEIRLTGDDLAERDEQFTITLTGDMTGKFKVRIVDDDRPPFSVAFDQQTYTAAEGAATLTLTRSGDVSKAAAVTLHFEPTLGHGGWPADFDVAFAAGQTTKTVTIPADDEWYTGDRTATLELRTDGLLGATAEVTLHDDEPQPVVTLLGATVREGAPGEVTEAIVTILLSAPLGVDLDVRATTNPGSAGADDYTPLDGKRLSIRVGEMAATVTLQVRGDDAAEGNETFHLALTHCCDPAIGAQPLTATVTIHDDDNETDPPPPGRRRSVRH